MSTIFSTIGGYEVTREEEIEIRMRYREARDKGEQVKILSQMFLTTEAEICRVLGIRTQKEARELRKREGLALLAAGVSKRETARRLGISEGMVRRWAEKG